MQNAADSTMGMSALVRVNTDFSVILACSLLRRLGPSSQSVKHSQGG
jgi:hypothetical protein